MLRRWYWRGRHADRPAAQLANQFVSQFQAEEFILTVGQLSPPILLGDETEQREQAENLSYVPVKVVARLAFTRQRLEEMIVLLKSNLDTYDRQRGKD